MGKHQVTIPFDWTVPMISAHVNAHLPPPPPSGVSYPHAEIPAMIGHLPGAAQHKLTYSVFHQGLPIAQDGHDCGNGILHLCFPPHNVLLPVHALFSKRKTMFGASTVRMNFAQTGLIDAFGLCPMLMCADPISWPAQWAPTNVTNTVYVGSTAGDIYGGWVGYAVNALIEAIIYKVADVVAHKLTHDKFWHSVFEYTFKRLLKWVLPYDKPSKAAKKFIQELVDSPSSGPTPVTPTKDSSVIPLTTKSPFGDSSIRLDPNSDGSFDAITSSPTSSSGRTEQQFGGLGLFGPADEDRQELPEGLEALLRKAPLL